MIRVDSIYKELGEFSLRGVSLQIERGEYFVVLGPTGSGKTVLIECIAGLLQVDAGRVFIDSEDVTDLPPELRRVGYVPQDYVLFPHLTVFENIAFALRLHRWDDTEVRSRVTELAEMLHISHLLDRHPRTLSGGEQQRSALARALAFHPRVLLLDEPLSALDEGTRAELSIELSRISNELNTTVIHVCHNFDEAIDLGDRIAIVRSGEVIQVGTPSDIFRRPNCRFVARFVRSENIFPATVAEQERRAASVCPLDFVDATDTTARRIPISLADGPRLLSDGSVVDGPMIATIRPEDISVTATDPGPRDNLVRGSLRKIDDRGRYLRLYVDGDINLVAIMTRQAYHAEELSLGGEVYAAFPAEAVHLLPEDG